MQTLWRHVKLRGWPSWGPHLPPCRCSRASTPRGSLRRMQRCLCCQVRGRQDHHVVLMVSGDVEGCERENSGGGGWQGKAGEWRKIQRARVTGMIASWPASSSLSVGWCIQSAMLVCTCVIVCQREKEKVCETLSRPLIVLHACRQQHSDERGGSC